MTFKQLHAIAARRGTVRWEKSGIVEHLVLSRDQKVILARPLKQLTRHPIVPPKAGVEPLDFHCIEVDGVTKQPIRATVFNLKAVASPKNSPLQPAQEPMLAPGVRGVVLEEPDGFYIPLLVAVQEGEGAVSRFLDALPTNVRIVFPTVVNAKLEAMLLHRGFKKTQLEDPILHVAFDALERLPS